MSSVSLEAAAWALPACSRGVARRLRQATLRLLEKHPAAAGWISLLDDIAWEHRRHVLQWVLGEDIPPVLTPALREALLAALEEYPACYWKPKEFGNLVEAVARGVRLEAIVSWSWLRGTGEVFASLRSCCGPEFELPVAVMAQLVEEWNWPTRSLLWDAWNSCGKSPGLVNLLRDARFVALAPPAQAWLIDLFRENGAALADLWELLIALEALTDGDRESLVGYNGMQTYLLAKLPPGTALSFVRHWPGLRGAERAGLLLAMDLVADMGTECRAAVSGAPASAFARIGKARRNRQMWSETAYSLRWLGEVSAPLFCNGLLGKPELLFACGERLTAFGRVRSQRLLRGLRRHALFAPLAALTDGPDALVALDRVLCAHRELAPAVPVFMTWERHFAGEKVLGRRAIEEVGAQMLEGLTAMRLRFVMEQVEGELALFGDAHAGLLRAGLRTGRHPMMRFLREFALGRDTRLTHPANREWLRKRPEFPLATWLHPLRITLPVAGLGEVTLDVEVDAFEVLRVGTYARSCLAAGAVNSGNAVAVLLDVNKRVVFARDASGRFLARQIVAVSECGRLVCHSVYPEKTPTALEDFFQLYVEDWALQMRMEMARGDEEVIPLVVGRWYDDGVWARFASSPE